MENSTQKDSHNTNKITRLELRLNMVSIQSDKSIGHQLQRQLQELLDKLLEVDNKISVVPWFDRAETTPLQENKVPNDQRRINRYFQRIQPKLTGFSYGEVQIQHNRRWEDIICDMTPWLTENKHGLYYQTLQCPTTTYLGWLLWSFRRIDTSRLQKEIANLFGFKVNLRYQNIAEGKEQTQQDNMVRALHIIVDQKQADQVSNRLQKIYSFKAMEFPLGIVLRFIPHALRVKADKTPKIIKWRSRQKTFLQAIEDPTKPMLELVGKYFN
jgi:hypothetical protein